MKRARYFFKAAALLLVAAFATFATLEDSSAREPVLPTSSFERPNILLIVVDDMGYSDVGCFGGEIETPRLDSLADRGVRFTSFYNTVRCWPTRSAILTGYYAPQVGCDPPKGPFPDWRTYFPQYLQRAGYWTQQSGKWHVSCSPKILPAGFDASYEILDHDRHFNPQKSRENDVALPPVAPNSGYYSTTAIAEKTIEQLKRRAQEAPEKPFFALTAFLAPHFPLMAPAEDVAKYAGKYDVGWDEIRARRLEKMRKLGIYDGELAPREEKVGPPYRFKDVPDELGPGEAIFPVAWDSLTDVQKRFQGEKMSAHAAMVDRVDREIGKILDYLRETGELDKTFVFFLSDNGASAELMIRGDRNDVDAAPGSPESFRCLGPGFASAANAPFRRYKTWVCEGGISTPLIVAGPGLEERAGTITAQRGHVVDLAPTILELAGIAPNENFPAEKPYPGESFASVLKTGETFERGSIWFGHEGNKALIRGDRKIVLSKNDQTPGAPEKWSLYDLSVDRAEQNDLSDANPELVREMVDEWTATEKRFRADAAEKKER